MWENDSLVPFCLEVRNLRSVLLFLMHSLFRIMVLIQTQGFVSVWFYCWGLHLGLCMSFIPNLSAKVLCSFFHSQNQFWLLAILQLLLKVFHFCPNSGFGEASPTAQLTQHAVQLLIEGHLTGCALSWSGLYSCCSPDPAVASLWDRQEPARGRLHRNVQVKAGVLRENPELAACFIFKCPRNLGGRLTED